MNMSISSTSPLFLEQTFDPQPDSDASNAVNENFAGYLIFQAPTVPKEKADEESIDPNMITQNLASFEPGLPVRPECCPKTSTANVLPIRPEQPATKASPGLTAVTGSFAPVKIADMLPSIVDTRDLDTPQKSPFISFGAFVGVADANGDPSETIAGSTPRPLLTSVRHFITAQVAHVKEPSVSSKGEGGPVESQTFTNPLESSGPVKASLELPDVSTIEIGTSEKNKEPIKLAFFENIDQVAATDRKAVFNLSRFPSNFSAVTRSPRSSGDNTTVIAEQPTEIFPHAASANLSNETPWINLADASSNPKTAGVPLRQEPAIFQTSSGSVADPSPEAYSLQTSNFRLPNLNDHGETLLGEPVFSLTAPQAGTPEKETYLQAGDELGRTGLLHALVSSEVTQAQDNALGPSAEAARFEQILKQIEPKFRGLKPSQSHENETQSLKMRLHPAELGAVEITLVRHESGSVSAQITAETEAAYASLNDNMIQLRESLENAGLQIEKLEVGHRSASSTGQGGNQNGQGHSHPAYYQPDAVPDHGGISDSTDETPNRLVSLRA